MAYSIMCACFPAVLQGCKGLVAVWFLFLRAAGLHSFFLHSDDLRDAQSQERQPPNSPQRAPQTG